VIPVWKHRGYTGKTVPVRYPRGTNKYLHKDGERLLPYSALNFVGIMVAP